MTKAFISGWQKKVIEGLQWSFKESEPYFATFGIAVLIGVVGFYFINPIINFDDIYENSMLRITAGISMVPLIFARYWPFRLRKFLIFYWYAAFIYVLPFFFTFMILMNIESNIWHLNGLICLLVMVLFVDLGSLLLLLSVGVLLGLLYFQIKSGGIVTILEHVRFILFSYLGPLVYIILFSRKRERIQKQKLDHMKLVAESVAHELRTPLSAMTMVAQALGKILPTYYEGYVLAKEANLPIKGVTPQLQKYFKELPTILDTVSRNANSMVSLLLANLHEETKFEMQTCSMKACVQTALESYPFSEGEKHLVCLDVLKQEGDFKFIGHSELMKHVLFNLLKNSLYAIASAGKGEITISIEPLSSTSTKEKYNKLVFTDTGSGIDQKNIYHIFDRFYSSKEHGTGIGLAFCRATIQEFGGRIACTSTLGEYTTFTLLFPSTEEGSLNG